MSSGLRFATNEDSQDDGFAANRSGESKPSGGQLVTAFGDVVGSEFVAGAGEDREARVLGKAWVGLAQFAQHED